MELIAASRIVKAQQRVAAVRAFSERITEVIRNLPKAGDGRGSPLLEAREEIRTVCFVVVAADRGLAGGYNSSVIRLAERALLAERAEGRQTALITVGKKAHGYFRFRGYEIAESFSGFSDDPSYEDARAVAAYVTEKFEAGDYDQVRIAYTRFLSLGTQRGTDSTLLPPGPPPSPSLPLKRRAEAEAPREGPTANYEFEPSPDEILERLLPRY